MDDPTAGALLVDNDSPRLEVVPKAGLVDDAPRVLVKDDPNDVVAAVDFVEVPKLMGVVVPEPKIGFGDPNDVVIAGAGTETGAGAGAGAGEASFLIDVDSSIS